MKIHCNSGKNIYFLLRVFLFTVIMQGCSNVELQQLPSSAALEASAKTQEDYRYIIGAGDTLDIFVWKNADVSTSVIVRPDGMINAPLVN